MLVLAVLTVVGWLGWLTQAVWGIRQELMHQEAYARLQRITRGQS